ncbi:hypothetical protein FRC01_008627, partial [Tulasnella sp. 417]
PQPCYILKLPSDVLEEIIRTHLALTPGNYYLNAIKTLSLVHRSWLPTTRYLAYVKVAFIPKSIPHAARMLGCLKMRLPSAPVHSEDFVPTEQTQRASCRTLFIAIIGDEAYDAHKIGLELLQLVGHSLRTLELRGLAGAFWGPREALTATLEHVTFLPRLRQLKVLDIGTWTLMAYLCAIWKGDGKAGPSGLVIHHDFELPREKDLLSIPIDVLATVHLSSKTGHRETIRIINSREWEWARQEFLDIANSSLASNEVPILDEDDRRPPLELYISRRSHVGDFILALPKVKVLMSVLQRSVKTVDVWLKDQEEIGSELAFAIASLGWEHHIDRNVADGSGETTHFLLHEF